MSSKALQISDRLIALMSALNEIDIFASNNVFVAVSTELDSNYAFELRDLPGISITLGDEVPSPRVVIGMTERTVQTSVKILSKAHLTSDPFNIGDQVMVEAHSRIMEDTSLNGLAIDVRHVRTNRSRDVLEKPVSITELIYEIDYRTTTASLEL